MKFKDKEKFLLSEMPHFEKTNIKDFKKYMEGSETTCENCGVYYWNGCKKRCNC
jgi:hypothetical protein